ncbi:MAG: SDR family NAD(P)-dependent oxidoreductase [Acidobacteriota bacterium]
MNIVFLGATKGMGRALARRLADRGDRLFLLGRDADDLERSARDLDVRSGRNPGIEHASCDLLDADTFGPALDAAETALGRIDAVIVTAGIFGQQDDLEGDPAAIGQLIDVDFRNTVLFCEAARERLVRAGGGSLCVFSSVAGDRGRKPTVLYGAAKAGLQTYLEGLDHRYATQGLHVLDVRPGFVHTGMTAGLKAPPFAGDPETVARDVVAALDGRKAVLYTPFPWGWVMRIVRALPRFVMRRVGF